MVIFMYNINRYIFIKELISLFVDCTTKFYLDNYDKKTWVIDYSKILDIDNLPGEKWYNIIVDGINYTRYYQASNFCRVRSIDRCISRKVKNKRGKYCTINCMIKGKILKPTKAKNGYYVYDFSKNGNGHIVYLHRIMGNLFVKNDDPEHKTFINHKDENKLNNLPDNLEWCTNEYNIAYGTARQKQGESLKESHKNRKNWNEREVVQVDFSGNYIKTWRNAKEASKFGYNQRSIGLCCKNIRKTSKGYIWFYKEDYTKENVDRKIKEIPKTTKIK